MDKFSDSNFDEDDFDFEDPFDLDEEAEEFCEDNSKNKKKNVDKKDFKRIDLLAGPQQLAYYANKAKLKSFFTEIQNDKDILALADRIVREANMQTGNKVDNVTYICERSLYACFIGYIWYEAPPDEANLVTLDEVVLAFETDRYAGTKKADLYFRNAFEMLIDEMEEEYPHHFVVKQYKQFYNIADRKDRKKYLADITIWLNKVMYD